MNKLGVRILLIGWPERTINDKYLDRVKQEREIAGSSNAFSRAKHAILCGQWEAHTWQQETFLLSQVYPSLSTDDVSFSILLWSMQWRIQDFPEEGAPTPRGGGANIRFCQIFLKTAWNWKNLGPQGGTCLARPLKSVTAMQPRNCL